MVEHTSNSRWFTPALCVAVILLAGCSERSKVEDSVRRTMVDPDAAQFRDVVRCTGDTSVWRGEVNGKNRIGAFVGFTPFYYSGYHASFPEDYDFNDLMNRCFSDLRGAESETSAEPASSAVEAAKSPAPDLSVPAPKAKFTPAQDPDAGKSGSYHPKLVGAERCWADYCPCDTSDPDYGYLDVSICRDLRMGQPVSDSTFSIGAKSRDGRRALRELNAEN